MYLYVYVLSMLHRLYKHIGFALVHKMHEELLRGGDERGEQASVSEVQMGDSESPNEKWLQLAHHELMSSNYCTAPS